VTAGEELSLSYAGFQPGEQVSLVMRSTPVELGTFTADAAGIVTADFALPASAEAGSHTLTFSGPVTGDHVVRFRLAAEQRHVPVAAPSSAASGPALPLALGGSALLLLIAGGLVLHRRRAGRPGQAAPTGTDPSTPPTQVEPSVA
jgi:hypothetical protein